MNVRKVKHTTHLWNYVVFGLVIALAAVSLLISEDTEESGSLRESAELIFLLPLAFVALLFVYFCYQVVSFWIDRYAIAKRTGQLKKYAKYKGMYAGPFAPIGSALFSITKKKPQFKNSFRGDSWSYTDFVFHELSDNYKRERYTTNSYHFAVASFDLPRVLPNVFFDSKRSGSREFQLLFREDQRHDLEGDFHTHFATYFTEDYTIDSLAFITPDVMLALVDANQYDIEIFANRLYLINELETMPEQLVDMEQKGKAIREALKRNILTYRDDRIDRSIGRKTISIAGLLLRRSYRKYSVMLGFGVVVSLASLLLYANKSIEPQLALSGIIIGLGVIVYSCVFIVDIMKMNHRLRLHK